MMVRGGVARMPYPCPFSKGEQLVIEEAICVGLTRVLRMGIIDPHSAKEVDFTTELVEELNRMMDFHPPEVEGFSSGFLETIPKGGELRNYNGNNVEKRPDMLFRRAGRLPSGTQRDYCGIFVECKIVDADHPMSLYCGEGIARFVRGEYAWAMSLGMLVGYARGSYALPNQLNTHLKKFGPRYKTHGKAQQRSIAAASHPIYVTVHERGWHYSSGGEPGALNLLHLWLKVA